ncbi:MAG: hypothetical protein AB8B69_26080 [Chitinophagales bacterium]
MKTLHHSFFFALICSLVSVSLIAQPDYKYRLSFYYGGDSFASSFSEPTNANEDIFFLNQERIHIGTMGVAGGFSLIRQFDNYWFAGISYENFNYKLDCDNFSKFYQNHFEGNSAYDYFNVCETSPSRYSYNPKYDQHTRRSFSSTYSVMGGYSFRWKMLAMEPTIKVGLASTESPYYFLIAKEQGNNNYRSFEYTPQKNRIISPHLSLQMNFVCQIIGRLGASWQFGYSWKQQKIDYQIDENQVLQENTSQIKTYKQTFGNSHAFVGLHFNIGEN